MKNVHLMTKFINDNKKTFIVCVFTMAEHTLLEIGNLLQTSLWCYTIRHTIKLNGDTCYRSTIAALVLGHREYAACQFRSVVFMRLSCLYCPPDLPPGDVQGRHWMDGQYSKAPRERGRKPSPQDASKISDIMLMLLNNVAIMVMYEESGPYGQDILSGVFLLRIILYKTLIWPCCYKDNAIVIDVLHVT